jgi:hypothetical protein
MAMHFALSARPKAQAIWHIAVLTAPCTSLLGSGSTGCMCQVLAGATCLWGGPPMACTVAAATTVRWAIGSPTARLACLTRSEVAQINSSGAYPINK